MTTTDTAVNSSYDNYTLYRMEFPNFTEDDSFSRKLLTYYLMGVGGMTISCLGIIGNILSIVVLTTKSMRSSTYMYLAALAACDTLVLIVTMLMLIKDTKPPQKFSVDLFEEPYYAFIFPYVHPIAVTFQVTSIWLTLAFTVDRYIMICHPFRAETMCSRGRARKVIVSLFVSGIVFNLPRFFEYNTLEITYEDMNNRTMEMYMIELTEMGNNEYFKEIVHSWLYLICVCGLPFLTLAVLNYFLIRAVHLSRKKGKEINVREKRRNDTTIMLIGVVVVFLICQGPALVSRMMWAFSSLAKLDSQYHTLSEVANFLVIMNSAINIVPYYFFGKKFRKEFWRLFCSCVFNKEELRKMTRSFSISVADGNRKHHVVAHEINGMEMNGLKHLHPAMLAPKDGVAAPLIGERERSVSDVSDLSGYEYNQKKTGHFYPSSHQLQVNGKQSGYLIASTVGNK
ncbi:FMRFamide receptor-like [Haliotis rubra]|uniref:FMRFamide receptor-like n=1 Tax=Haliotis rubra TaxID=36100 RepID=UPI001EE54D66|nr:FMRFamide receptor-like [Haliotis rubra]